MGTRRGFERMDGRGGTRSGMDGPICILCLDTQVPGMQIRRLGKLVGNGARVNNGDENICAATGESCADR